MESDINSDCDTEKLVDYSVCSLQPANDPSLFDGDDLQPSLNSINQSLKEFGKTPNYKEKLKTKKYSEKKLDGITL